MPLLCYSQIDNKRNYNTHIAKLQEEEQDNKVKDKKNNIINENLEFPIDINDVLFTLTFNPSVYKENVANLISKLAVIKGTHRINLFKLSKILGYMGMKKLFIFYIDDSIENMHTIKKDNGCILTYTEINKEQFITILNSKANFLDYNKYSLYILRNGGFLGIKNLFNNINDYQVNIGRGGSQKAHILSPLDFRLSSYLLAIFNFDYKKLSYINAFDDLEKDRYLSYIDYTSKIRFIKSRFKEFRAITLDKMPDYLSNEDLDLYVLRCTPCPECNQ
jgi:hypothetical protein